MAETTWLQCTVNKQDWEAINARRLKLGLKWNELLLPATLAYLTQLEASPPTKAEETKPKTKGTKQQEVNK